MPLSSITSVVKLLLDVISTGRSALRDREKGAGLFKPYLIADTREYLERLRARTRELINAFRKEDEEVVWKKWEAFYHDLLHLSERVSALNLNILDVYNPDIANKLAAAYGYDSIVFSYFERESRSENKTLPKRLSSKTEKTLADLDTKFNNLNLYDIYFETKDSFSDLVNDRDDCISELENLEKLLDEVSSVFAEFLRENWSPKDLT